MSKTNTRAIILAAGKATRFKTNVTKLLYTICGQPMILFPIKMFKKLGIPSTLVLGYQAEEVKKEIEQTKIKNLSYIEQKDQLGTGNAVYCSKETWDKDNILIINGDMPLLDEEILTYLLKKHSKNKADLSFLCAHALNPKGYGRVIKEDNKVCIVEEKNCTKEQLNISLVNAGVYLINKKVLEENINKLKEDSISGEIYFTDLIQLASDQGLNVQALSVPYDSIRGINNLQELWAAEQIKRSEIMRYWMDRGVRFELAQSIHVDIEAKIGAGSFIGTGVHLLRNTVIGENCTINAFSIIENTTIENNSRIHSHSVIQDSKIGSNANIGPFARLRNNVVIKDNVDIGNFVEIKNSEFEKGSKAKHLSYIGDAKIGKSVNIGAGVITCNYDGKNKHKTEIEDNSFIGSNNSLVAPLKIGKNSYTAAGSTITRDVPKDSLAIARSRQDNKVDYSKKLSSKKNDKQKDKQFNFIGAVKTEKMQSL